MYLPIPPQPDCFSAWRAAVRAVDDCPGHEAQNVIIDVADPLARSTLADPAVTLVDNFLRQWNAKPIETVANTLFPAALHRRYGSPDFYTRFVDYVLPAAARGGDRWSGYYFERMINLPRPDGGVAFNQLDNIVDRLKDPSVKALNKFELSVFDPLRDVDRSPYGGQCLSHASFKPERTTKGDLLHLTVLYRNHYYIEKLLGNLIGLGRLMAFVAQEANLQVGALTVVSSHAIIDQPRNRTKQTASRAAIKGMLADCDALDER